MGIFDHSGIFVTYRATLQFRDKCMGGIPKDPKLMDAWLRVHTGIDEVEERRRMLLRTMQEMGMQPDPDMPYEQLLEVSNAAALKMGVGFKRDEQGLYLEDRLVKAMLRECVNILYAGQKEGPTRKGAKNYFVERVFVNPSRIYLGASEPSGVDLFVGHISDASGPHSTLTYYEYVLQPRITFDVWVLKDLIKEAWWPEIWVLAQENALGALRSQSFGRFDIEQWELVEEPMTNPVLTSEQIERLMTADEVAA